jgi:carboxymethylenebutenolidase
MVEQQTSQFEGGQQKYGIDRYAMRAGAAQRPVVVLLHGVDGMGGESGTGIGTFAEQIAAAGFLVYVPHYFDVADGADSLPLEQLFVRRVPRVGIYPARVAAAVDHVLARPEGNGQLGLVGFSLGGGLAIEYAQSAPGKVQALVDYFGYIADPRTYANAGLLPPTLILHNKADAIVKIRESSTPLLEALGRTTVVHDHRFYDDANPERGNHPFFPGGPADVDSRARSVAWLRSYCTP